MEKRVFILQGSALLLPSGFSDIEIALGVPSENADLLSNYETINIPAIDEIEPAAISVISILPETQFHEKTPQENWIKIPVKQILSMLSANGGFSGANCRLSRILRAFHIIQWRNESRYCGNCGAENLDVFHSEHTKSPDIHRRCTKCARLEYPRICPAVIVVITDDQNRILLAHNKNFKPGVYSLISGFNEAGETLEASAEREIREEVNIRVKDLTYVKSQAWPFPNSLMIGFKARYNSGVLRPDGIEIEDAEWFSKDNLPVLPAEGSLSRSLINSWLDGTLWK